MVADVPLGAFLSGGVDSSTVVALMQAHSARPVRTFSIGFEQDRYDEAPYARAVARHLGTDHAELYVSSAQAIDLIPRLPEWYDEPFADPSQIPTYLMCQLARQRVTVALSGDGGDELFGGYQRYAWTEMLWRWMKGVPRPLRTVAGKTLANLPLGSLDRALSVIPPRLRPGVNGHRLQRLGELLPAISADELYQRVLAVWANPYELMLNSAPPLDPAPENTHSAAPPGDLLSRMQLLDTLTYLPDDILTKVDRASMAVSLEARVPLLDHRLVEFAWTLPARLNTVDGRGKFPLRQVLAQYVPTKLIDRPKQGFGVPLGEWLRGPLRPWAESLLSVDAIQAHDVLDTARVRQLWREHLEGRRNAEARLWLVLMLQAWLVHWRS